MFIKKICLSLCLVLGISGAYAQAGDFCDAVTAITHDAPNDFRNIKGKFRSSDATASIWDCGIKVPGVINSRFVSAMGLFYEGAFFQSASKDQLKAVYDKYQGMLTACLSPQGYSLSVADNFYPGLAEYKKLVFMQQVSDAKMDEPPPHLAMEAIYNKDIKKYTLVLFIFKN